MYNGDRRPLTRNDHRPIEALHAKDDKRLSDEIDNLYNVRCCMAIPMTEG